MRQETELVAQRKTTSKKSSKARTATKAATRATKATTKATKASPKTRGASGRRSASSGKSAKSAGAREVTIDRRRTAGRRSEDKDTASKPSQPTKSTAPAPKLERRKKVNRRRQIDPTTCERDYTDDEIQFMNALDEYKRTSGRMFPTCSEVLEVVRSLGYVRLSPSELAERQADPSAADPAAATDNAEVDATAHHPELVTV